MTRIATAAENALVLFYMQQNLSNADDLNAQISTGLTAQTYSQIAPQAAQLVDFRTETAHQQGFIDTIDRLSTRMQTMDLSLEQIQKAVASFRSLLPNGAFNQAQPDIAAQAKGLMVQITGYLNIQDGNRYVFGGTNTDSPPVDTSNLPIGAAASLTQLVNGPPSSNGYYAGGAATPPVRIDTHVTVDYSITANDSQTFEPIMRVLNFLAQNAPFSNTNPVDQANVSKAGQILDQAVTALGDMEGKLGLQEQQVNNEKTVHTTTLNIAQNGIGNIVTVDQATAITKLQTLETQIQASFSATSQIQKLSLVNFMG
jgi:flagellar hook-associated protein 3 FlgL